MEVALAIIGLFIGILSGIIAMDFHQRAKDRKALNEAEDRIRKAQEALSELHNQANQNLKFLTDKVSGLEMKMIAPQAGTVMRKF